MNERKKVFSKENINSSALLNYLFHGNFLGSGKEVWEVGVGTSGRIGQLVLCSAPSVPQPVVQSRRRPLLGPSPG